LTPIASRQFQCDGSSWRVSVDEGGAAPFDPLDEAPAPRSPGLRFFNAATGESRFLACDVTRLQTQKRLDGLPHARLVGLLQRAMPVGESAP
jgi:hypothetical protein